MKNSLWLVALAIPLLIPCAAVTQEADSIGRAPGSVRHERKNPVVAGLIEYVVPVPLAGHWYAGDVRWGIPAALAQLAGGGVMILGYGDCEEGRSCGVLRAGFATFVIAKAWAVATAYQAARDYNRKQQTRPSP